jgi:hypothetical protein
MGIKNLSMKGGENSDGSLKVFQFMNFIVWICYFSPVIVAGGITCMSFLYQNFKGFIYLFFLISICLFRNFLYSGGELVKNDGTICTKIQYSDYKNSNATFSSFVFAFTITYLSIPMFVNGSPNFWLFISLVTYFFIDMFIRLYKNCIVKINDLIVNILSGVSLAALIVTILYSFGGGKYLFFNEVSSDKEICYQPKQQTFKCQVYKNGELIGTV